MHPEIKESLKLSNKGSYYKQEDFYSSTDESNEDTNSNRVNRGQQETDKKVIILHH
jgi:hypothetical protein